MRRTLAILLLSTLSITACSSNSSASSGDSATGTAASCAPAGGPVTLSFTSWVPDIQKVVDLWNQANPNIQVKVQTGPNGNGGTYQNFFNQLKAGNAPDLGQIEYDALPSFRVQDGLFDVGACDVVAQAKDKFIPWMWGQVSLGDDKAAYGVPQDAGPMAL